MSNLKKQKNLPHLPCEKNKDVLAGNHSATNSNTNIIKIFQKCLIYLQTKKRNKIAPLKLPA